MNREVIQKEEQETTIVVNPSVKMATVYSCIPSMIKRLEKLGADPEVEIIRNDKYGITVRIPDKWVKISKPKKRTYTDEQREALKERLKAARSVAFENRKAAKEL